MSFSDILPQHVVVTREEKGSRVDDVEGNVHEIWYEQQVTLWTSSPTLGTERLLIGKTEQQESDVVGQVVEGLIIESNTLLKVAIVPVREGETDHRVQYTLEGSYCACQGG